jgi:hypothetical protein
MDITLELAIIGIILAAVGIAATFFVALSVDKSTKKLIKRIEAIQTAEMPLEKYKTVIRYLEDMERTGVKHGTIQPNKEGKSIIAWEAEIKTAMGMSTGNDTEMKTMMTNRNK